MRGPEVAAPRDEAFSSQDRPARAVPVWCTCITTRLIDAGAERGLESELFTQAFKKQNPHCHHNTHTHTHTYTHTGSMPFNTMSRSVSHSHSPFTGPKYPGQEIALESHIDTKARDRDDPERSKTETNHKIK